TKARPTSSLSPLSLHDALPIFSDTIPVTGSRTIQTDGVSNTLAVGWAEILTSGSIGGTAIFGAQVAGQADSEAAVPIASIAGRRSEEHTSELQSRENLVCRLLL